MLAERARVSGRAQGGLDSGRTNKPAPPRKEIAASDGCKLSRPHGSIGTAVSCVIVRVAKRNGDKSNQEGIKLQVPIRDVWTFSPGGPLVELITAAKEDTMQFMAKYIADAGLSDTGKPGGRQQGDEPGDEAGEDEDADEEDEVDERENERIKKRSKR
eukprot:jgi/Mesvir1/1179/Mv24007-RA.1